MIPKKVYELAQEEGFPCVEYVGKWNKYEVYEPYFPPVDGITPPTGLPVFIFQNHDGFRLSTTEEAFAYLEDSRSK